VLLPGFEDDRPVVFLPRTVLGEEARQMRAIEPDDRGRPVILEVRTGAVVGKGALEELQTLADDLWVPGVERDAQAFGSRHTSDMSVAEV
jgi:hypothetical protein